MGGSVVIIDSGIGGLTVYNHLLSNNKDACITYLADNQFFPYGTKEDEELIKIIKRLIDYFLKNNYSKIILACNTASRIYNTYLKETYGAQVYSIIESTIAELYQYPESKNLLIIGTSNTIHSKIYNEEIKKNFNMNIIAKVCTSLVEYCENNETALIHEYIKQQFCVFKNNIDTLILGCTHFNILGKEFEAFFDHQVNIIYSGYSLIETIKNDIVKQSQTNQIYLTKNDRNYKNKIIHMFPELKNCQIEELNISFS